MGSEKEPRDRHLVFVRLDSNRVGPSSTAGKEEFSPSAPDVKEFFAIQSDVLVDGRSEGFAALPLFALADGSLDLRLGQAKLVAVEAPEVLFKREAILPI